VTVCSSSRRDPRPRLRRCRATLQVAPRATLQMALWAQKFTAGTQVILACRTRRDNLDPQKHLIL